MLLVIDIGNTNIVFGLYDEDELGTKHGDPAHKWRMISDVKKSSDDYAIDIIESLVSAKFDVAQISACIIGSVVPKLSEILQNALAKFFAGKILVVGSENVKLQP